MMAAGKRKGLGRGLDALLGAPTAVEEALRSVDIDCIDPGRYQPRTRMDPQALQELAASIRAQGVMQPLLVRPVGERYELIAGERRWRAARMAGLLEVPCLVREIPDEAALAMSLIENLQREDLNPFEEAQGLQRLIDEFGMTHQQAAEAVGRSRSAVTNLLRLLQLAEPVRELLMEGALEMGHARALLALAVPQQVELARRAAVQGWSVRQTERAVQALLAPPAPKPEAVKDPDWRRLEEALSEHFGAPVLIKRRRDGRGTLEISFADDDTLEGLLERLGVRA
ncbi:ParB/RepB/Spo0J family partition protein [Tepidimonas aquatica]|nr:ParB/RepB/Spo0J family partition protein [Tepidimonas aquatica]